MYETVCFFPTRNRTLFFREKNKPLRYIPNTSLCVTRKYTIYYGLYYYIIIYCNDFYNIISSVGRRFNNLAVVLHYDLYMCIKI